jgi:imidazolonepropionase
LGFRLKVHSDEFANLGCTAMAAELGAVSADHLVASSTGDMAALARAGTVAVLLPGTTFGLGSRSYADARGFVAHGVPVALGTDFNPGTCPCPSMPFILALAARHLRLTPAECLVAATANAAVAVGREREAGRLAEGRPADLVVLDTADYRELVYAFGDDVVAGVMIGGVWGRPLTGTWPESVSQTPW